MGFFDKLSTGWSFIKEAFAMGFRDRSLFKPSVYLTLVSILYFIGWVAAIISLDVNLRSGTGALLGAICCFGSFVIFYFFSGMTVNMVDVHLKGGQPRLGEAFKDASKNFGAILTLALVSTLVDMLVKALRGDNDSVVGNIIGGIIDAIWTVVTFLVLPAIIIEDISLGKALKRVRSLHKDNLLLIGVGEVGVRLVTGVLGFVMGLIIFGVVYFSLVTIGGTVGIALAIGVGGTLLTLFSAFNTFVRMAYYTCLYLWAADVEAKGPQAPAPLPLARALGKGGI